MEHGIEVLLQVDPLGQAVGTDEDELAAIGDEGCDALLALGRGEPSGDRFHAGLPRKRAAKVARDVLRGIDEAAEDGRM